MKTAIRSDDPVLYLEHKNLLTLKGPVPDGEHVVPFGQAAVAREALTAGAVMVNDVWGLRRDPDMADVAARHKVPVILMHNRSKPQDAAFEARLGGRYTGSQYEDLISDIMQELTACVQIARGAGIADGVSRGRALASYSTSTAAHTHGSPCDRRYERF